MKIVDYLTLLVLIILLISVVSCSAEEDHCYEYYYYDEELVNECVGGICTQIIQGTTTCISNEGE